MVSGGEPGGRWSLQAVERAAPDAASMAAARRLAAAGPWSETGSTDQLVWGSCQGSGRTPYQVSIDLVAPAYRCSCPSRKHPCKHALALLLQHARGDLGARTTPPDGAAGAGDRARQHAERAARLAAAAAEQEAAAHDPAAEAERVAATLRRREERLALMDGGVDDFGRWLTDLVRSGTAAARRRSWSWWDDAAARLVDAQLPGLADQVRECAAGLARRDDWADHLLAELGRWWSVVRAWQRRDELDDVTLADLRVTVGWAQPSAEVRATDEVVDGWVVLGAHRSDDGRLHQQRTWLRGTTTRETVLVLDFGVAERPLPTARLVGSILDGPVHRYPGSPPRRAVLGDLVVAGRDAPLPPGGDLAAALDLLAGAWAGNPWLARVPVVLEGARLLPEVGGAGRVVDPSAAVPMLDVPEPWRLAATTGGRPVRVFGELERGGFRPLAVEEPDEPVEPVESASSPAGELVS